jgi:phosphoglycolate phosphatase
MHPYTHVYFDLDGTLIDHFDAIHRSFSHAAEQMGLPKPSFEKVVATVGGSVPITASRLFPEADPTVIGTHFEAHFDTIMFETVALNEGTEWLLNRLHDQGTQCIVFTNKRGDKARKICEYLKLNRWLTGVVGTGDTPHRKPERAFSEHALSSYKATPATSCLIGDSPFDEQAAKAVGMDCFLVATGSHTRSELEQHTSSPVFDNLHLLGQSVFDFQ